MASKTKSIKTIGMKTRKSASRRAVSGVEKSRILTAVNEAAADLHEIGVIAKTTMREFDSLCFAGSTELFPQSDQGN